MHTLPFEKKIVEIERSIEQFEAEQATTGRDYADEIASTRSQLNAMLEKTYNQLTPWETVLVARHPRRPLARDYIQTIFTDFCELHGDKLFADDKAMVCGFARLGSQRVMVVGLHKGRDTREKIAANFGCAHPDGYRKALQKMKLAAKYGEHEQVTAWLEDGTITASLRRGSSGGSEGNAASATCRRACRRGRSRFRRRRRCTRRRPRGTRVGSRFRRAGASRSGRSAPAPHRAGRTR